MPSPNVLISGAGGQLGRRVVELLLEENYPGTIVAGTRDPAKLSGFAARGVTVRRLDWDDEASLKSAFAGVERALLISGNDLDRRGERQVRAVNAAVAAGVRHLSYTSMPTPERHQDIPIAPSHLETEEAIKASGVSHALLQNMWYADGLIDPLKRAIGEGKWITASGEGKIAYIPREDCARAAASVLAAAEAPTGTFAITGSEALSVREIAAFVAELTGKPIAVVDVTDEQMTDGLKAAQLPDILIRLIVGIERFNRNGAAAPVSDAVERLTGRKPQGIRDFLRASVGALKG